VLDHASLFAADVFRVSADATGDNKVNVFDLQEMALTRNKQQGQGGYDATCDFNGDDKINVLDLQITAANCNKW